MRGLKQWRLLAAGAGLTLALGLAACGGGDDNGGGGGNGTLDLTIGDSIPLTGDLSDFGPPGQKAADLAVAEINKAIQQAGVDHTVKVVHEDNETSPQAAVQAARKLVDSDNASCIAGCVGFVGHDPDGPVGFDSGRGAADLARVDERRDHGSRRRRAGQPHRAAGLVPGPDAGQRDGAEDLGGAEGKTVNIGARNDSYGTGLAETFGDAWKAQGGTVGQQVDLRPGAAELRLRGGADHVRATRTRS